MMDFHSKGAEFYRQVMGDAEDMLRRAVGTISATIAAQQEGAVIADQHRVLNFRGSGVVVSDDAPNRRINIDIAGGVPSGIGTGVQSATGTGKVFQLGTEPPGWQAVGFNDTAWATTLTDTQSRAVPSQWVTAQTGNLPNSATFLLRHAFTLPAGAVVSAILNFDVDNIGTVWINGTQVFTFNNSPDVPGWPFPVQVVSIPLNLFTAGGSNVLAVKVQNAITYTPAGPYAVGYKLAISSGSATGNGLMAQLSSDVSMVTANIFYDGPTLTLVPGTWFLVAVATLQPNGGTLTGKLWNGTTVVSSASKTSIAGEGIIGMTTTGVVTLTIADTYKMSVAATAGGGFMRAATVANPAGNTATTLAAARVA